MSSNDAADAGPDLTQGVSLADLGGGRMLRGHVGDEAVVLVRVGDEVLAVGASCTHYGGPLDQGTVEGETLRCPWHHACFSLRSASPLRTAHARRARASRSALSSSAVAPRASPPPRCFAAAAGSVS